MPITIVTCIVVVIYLSCSDARAAQESIGIAYPPDNVILDYEVVGISLAVPKGSADSIRVDVESRIIRIVPHQAYECFSLPLRFGINRVQIVALRGNDRVYSKTLEVLYAKA